MSFSGRVKGASHEGGLMVSFEGRPPRLGASIRISGGKILGRVNTVLGPVDDPLIHVHPLMEGIDTVAAVGSPVEIAPRVRSSQKKRHRGQRRENRSFKRQPSKDHRKGQKSKGRGRTGGGSAGRRRPVNKASMGRRGKRGRGKNRK